MLIEVGRRALAESGTQERHRGPGHRRGHQAAQRVGGQERRRQRRPALRQVRQNGRICRRAARCRVAGLEVAPPTAAAPTRRRAGSPRCRTPSAAERRGCTLPRSPARGSPRGCCRWSRVVGDRRGADDGLVASPAHPPVAGAVAAARATPVDVLPERVGPAAARAARRRRRWSGWPTTPEAEPCPARRSPTALGRRRPPVEVEVLHASYDVPGARLLDLVDRHGPARARCPWDRGADPPVAGEVPARGDLRDARGDRRAGDATHAPARGARRPAAAGRTSTPGSPRSTPTTASRSTTSPPASSTSSCTGTRTCSADSTSATPTRSSATGRRSRPPRRAARPCSTASRSGCPRWRSADKVLGRAAQAGVARRTPGPVRWATGCSSIVVEARAAGLDPEQELRDAVRRLTAAVRAAEPHDLRIVRDGFAARTPPRQRLRHGLSVGGPRGRAVPASGRPAPLGWSGLCTQPFPTTCRSTIVASIEASAPARSSTRAATPPSRSRSPSTTARSAARRCPRGASTGAFEAVELRDGGERGTAARACSKAVDAVLDADRPRAGRLRGVRAAARRPAAARPRRHAQQGASSAPTRSSASRSRSPGPPPTPPTCRCSATSAAPTPTCCRCR